MDLQQPRLNIFTNVGEDSITPPGNSLYQTPGPGTGVVPAPVADDPDHTAVIGTNADGDWTSIRPLSDTELASNNSLDSVEAKEDRTDDSGWNSPCINEMMFSNHMSYSDFGNDLYGHIPSSSTLFEYMSSLFNWKVTEDISVVHEYKLLEQNPLEGISLGGCARDGDPDGVTCFVQVEDADTPVALELLPGYAMVDSENYLSSLNDCLREYYSVMGKRPSKYHIMEHYSPRNPNHHSPPYLFVQSHYLSDDTKQALVNLRLNHDMTADQLTQFLYDYPSLGASFFQPKFPSVPNSTIRTLEIRKWDDLSLSGFKFKTGQIDLLLLNILKHSEHPLVDLFWARVSDVMDSFPSPTAEEPLPIAQTCLGKVEDLSKHQHLLPKFAQKEFLNLLKKEMERVQNEFGPLNELQTEEANVNFSALLGLFQFFECSARRDLVGMLDIIRAARECLNLLQVLFNEDYKIREDAALSFPLFDRDYSCLEEI